MSAKPVMTHNDSFLCFYSKSVFLTKTSDTKGHIKPSATLIMWACLGQNKSLRLQRCNVLDSFGLFCVYLLTLHAYIGVLSQ